MRANTACQENVPANTLVHQLLKSFHLGILFSVYKYVQTNHFCIYKELKLHSLVMNFHTSCTLHVFSCVVGDRGREPGKIRAGSGQETEQDVVVVRGREMEKESGTLGGGGIFLSIKNRSQRNEIILTINHFSWN